MHLTANAFTVTTALVVAFALFVVYIRWRNWLDSNVPLVFYVGLIAYERSVGGVVPMWLILVAFAFALTIRFEFMNLFFTRIVKVLELCAIGAIIYLCVAEIAAA